MSTLGLINEIHWLNHQEVLSSVPTYYQLGFCGIPSTNPGMPPDHDSNTVQSKQIHGTNISRITAQNFKEEFIGDGLQTSVPNITLTVNTADCLPILAGCRSKSVIAAHAGWRGIATGMTIEILRTFEEDQISPQMLDFWIGPAIGAGAFEVGPEVIQAFRKGLPALTEMDLCLSIHKGTKDRWFADLQTIAALSLCRAGVLPQNIVVVRSCTFKNPLLWYSYRRTGSAKPSNISWIKISPT